MGAGVLFGGKIMESIGDDIGDDSLKDAGKIVQTWSIGSGAGGVANKVGEHAVKGVLVEALKNL
jgi:hypothetical protein